MVFCFEPGLKFLGNKATQRSVRLMELGLAEVRTSRSVGRFGSELFRYLGKVDIFGHAMTRIAGDSALLLEQLHQGTQLGLLVG